MATPLLPGDSAPWFHAKALDGAERYAFDTVGGRHVMLLFVASAAAASDALALVARHRRVFDDARACFFGVTADPDDAAAGRIAQSLPGIRWFLDYDRAVAERYGATGEDGWLVLDPGLRVVARAPLDRGNEALAILAHAVETYAEPAAAPVLVVPHVIEPALCQALIRAYDAAGGVPSGFMREEGGITVARSDPRTKRRSDHHIADAATREAIRARIARFLNPPIERAFQFAATRIERYMVACYDDAEGGGFFRPHRDNTTRGTAHRRFAVTINLNADYDGGDLRFPEFGRRTYRAPVGGAVVFSCSLLHEALPVTRGRRYALLPFLYDEAGAKLREDNLAFVSDDLKSYRAGAAAQASAGGANGS